MVNTKDIENLREAIDKQDFDIEYFADVAKAIAKELSKEYVDRGYVYRKIDTLRRLEQF